MRLKPPLKLCLCFSLIFIACKKTEVGEQEETKFTSQMVNGLPADKKNINGYLYAEYLKYKRQNNNNTALYLFSAFSEPSNNLLKSYNHYASNFFNLSNPFSGNIDVGELNFNNYYKLQEQVLQSNFSYAYASYVNPDTMAVWNSEGNKTFAPLNVMVGRGFPAMEIDSASVALISKSGFTLDLTNKVSNCDSVVVMMVGWADQILVQKRAVKPMAMVFTSNDLAYLHPGQSLGYINICAFNYSNKIIDNRIYVFELSKKYTQNVTFVE